MSLANIHTELKHARIHHEFNYYQYNLQVIDYKLKYHSISIVLCGRCGNYMPLWCQYELSPHSTCTCEIKLK